jgi:hypothetical protein
MGKQNKSDTEKFDVVQPELAHIPDPEAQTIEKQYC